MKKALFTIALMLLPMLASAQDAVEVKGIYYNLDSEAKTAEVTANPDGYKGDVTIPRTVNYDGTTYNVTSIGFRAFKLCMGLKSITIPSGVKRIGSSAFYGCSGLTSITIPNSVTSIGNNAFEDCSGLTSVTIPNSVTTIGNEVFSGCMDLTSVTIPDGVTSIGYAAFYFCMGLTSITIPGSVTTISDCAFQDCSGLTSITIPNGVTTIGESAFMDCSDLTKITIPGSVTRIGDSAFDGCSSLTDVYCYVEKVLTSIKRPFFNALDIANATLHVPSEKINAYKSIEPWNQFKEIVALESAQTVVVKGVYYKLYSEVMEAEVTENPDKYQGHVSIPDAINYNGRTYSVKSIGENAFAGCTDLTSIKIPNGVTSIGKNAFVLCSGLTSVIIPGSVTSIEKGAFECCTGLTSITIPNGVTSISEKVFDLCTGLTSVTIPGSVTTIGKGAFWNCTSLTSVTIPNSVTEIGVFAFRECTSLTSVTIPGSVTFIGEAAFSFCSSLTSVTIPNSVTTIESGLFCYCSNMTSVTIGSGVTDIGIYAFRACTSLKDVYCHAENVPTTESNAFDESNIANATLYVPTVSTDAYKAAEPWKGFKEIVALEDAVPVNIGGIYYKLNTKKKTAEVKENPDGYQGDIIIPDAVKYGGKKYSVTSIGDYVFSNSGLTSVTIGNKVTTIGEGAFCITGAMTSVTIGSSVKTIGYCAFAYSGLTSVTIPGSVTTIEEMAFDYCINMTSLTIGSGVTSIGKYAFGGCRSMTDVICHAENVPTTDSKAFDESNANAILHVPAVSTDAYSATEPWNGFKEIVALEDLNGDGVVDAKDIVALVRRIAEGDFSATGVLSDNGSAAGDINGDGVVNAADVVRLANIIMGK